MKGIALTMVLAIVVSEDSAAGRQLAAASEADLAAFNPPAEVTAEPVTVDGHPGLRLTYSGERAVSVTVIEVPLDILDNTRLRYTATLSSENLATTACLEYFAVVGGQPYFSRALYDELSGTSSARTISAPFILRRGEEAEAARLGVRFDGPGTVTLSNLQLHDMGTLNGWPRPQAWGGIAGAALGAFTSIWAVLAIFLGLRGTAREPILRTTLLMGCASACAAVSGAILYWGHAPRELWYSLLLLGGIGTLNFFVLYGVLRRIYEKSEERRMLAMDLQ